MGIGGEGEKVLVRTLMRMASSIGVVDIVDICLAARKMPRRSIDSR